MKGMVFFTVLLFSATVWANSCPNLQGEYLCTVQDDEGNESQERIAITQSTKSGVTTYVSTNEDGSVNEIVADGKERVEKSAEEGFYLLSKQRVFCEKDTLRMVSHFQAALDENMKTVFAKIDATTGVALHAGKLLMSTHSKTWQKNPETGEETVEENDYAEECARL